jgi:methyl-accepting chemotaxis protein
LNFLPIINLHVGWKRRLEAYIAGGGKKKLDPKFIACDNHCKLGKWIYGAGKAYADSAAYGRVRAEHARFHVHAAAVVTFVNRGDKETATAVFNGEYALTSNNLKREIMELAGEVGHGDDLAGETYGSLMVAGVPARSNSFTGNSTSTG